MPARPAELLKDGGRPLLALLLLALMVKVVTALAALDANPLTTVLISDARYYLERAQGLAGLWADPLANQPHHLPPLYPRLLASVPGAVQGRFTGVLLLQALAGTGLLAGVWLLARRRLSRPASLLAVALTLAYGPLTFFETKLLGDSLACALMVAMLVAADMVGGARWPRVEAAIVGLLCALTALLRPQALLLVPVLAAWLFRRRWDLGIAALVTAGVVLLPSVLHNHRTSGDLILVSDNGGVNLWLANTGPVSGTFDTHLEAFADIGQQSDAARQVAENLAGRSLSPGGVSRVLARDALGTVLDDPVTFLRRVGRRALALLESFETGVVGVPAVERGSIPPLLLLSLPFGLLAGLAAAALVLGGRLATPPDDARATPAPALPLLAVGAVVVVTALVFFHYSRFRLPLVPLLALVAASGWDVVSRKPRPAAGRLAGAAIAGVAVLGLSLLPAPHHGTALGHGWTNLARARLLSAQDLAPAAQQEVLEAALADLDRALEAKPGFVRAEILAAETNRRLFRFAPARAHLERLAEHVPDHPGVQLEQAWLWALPHPDNASYDPDAARDLIARLRLTGADDPALQASLDALESLLARTSPGG